MRFFGFVLLIFPLFVNAADIYGKHHLCLANPQASYMTGDTVSAYPSCGKEYAVIHVPTELLELSTSQSKIQSLETQLSSCQTTSVSNQTLCAQQSIFSGQIAVQDVKWAFQQLFSLAVIIFSGVLWRAIYLAF